MIREKLQKALEKAGVSPWDIHKANKKVKVQSISHFLKGIAKSMSVPNLEAVMYYLGLSITSNDEVVSKQRLLKRLECLKRHDEEGFDNLIQEIKDGLI